MREEKQYLVDEVENHLEKSEYVFLTNYERVTVADAAELRGSLAGEGAEFHVVKNSALKHAAKRRSMPDFESELKGPVAIVIGGKNPSGVAKILKKFHKDKDEKCPIKIGVLGERMMTAEEVQILADLPSLDVLRAQFMGLLNTPAQQMARVVQAVPQGILNVLNAKAEKGGA